MIRNRKKLGPFLVSKVPSKSIMNVMVWHRSWPGPHLCREGRELIFLGAFVKPFDMYWIHWPKKLPPLPQEIRYFFFSSRTSCRAQSVYAARITISFLLILGRTIISSSPGLVIRSTFWHQSAKKPVGSTVFTFSSYEYPGTWKTRLLLRWISFMP